jgi:hypothetical protein
MNLTKQIAKSIRDVWCGGNWTAVNLKETLADVRWEQATTKVYSFNTIAALVYHINYFVKAVLMVLDGKPLDAHDKFSFDLTPINSQQDWEKLISETFTDAERCASLVEQLQEYKLWENFADEKYGSYYRNIHGLIEHTHYHLGQIVIIKKILQMDRK